MPGSANDAGSTVSAGLLGNLTPIPLQAHSEVSPAELVPANSRELWQTVLSCVQLQAEPLPYSLQLVKRHIWKRAVIFEHMRHCRAPSLDTIADRVAPCVDQYPLFLVGSSAAFLRTAAMCKEHV